MKPDRTEVRKVQQASMKLFELNKRFKEQEKQYKDEREKLQTKIKNYMYSNGCNKFDFKVHYKGDDELFNLSVTNVKQRKVIFDVSKLKQTLDKSILSLVIMKEYKIVDYKGLVKYLKSCGVDPKKFLSFVEVNESVNESELDRLGDIGEISLEDLKDCYEVRENNGYIKITETKGSEDGES